jgi:DNA modification methylase
VKEKELNIRLNKNLGEWDFDALANNFDEELLRLTGFDDKDLDKILGAAEATEDDPPDLPTSSKTAVGDVYALGDHRVMCGDATVAADMAKLMDGKPAEMVFTDPPWNVVIGGASNPQHRQRPGLMNDKMTSGEFRNFLRLTSQAFAPHVTGDVYCIMGASEWPQLDAVLREEGFHWSATIIWVKESFVVGRSKYHRRYEPIWYGWKKDAKSSYRGDRAQDDVWEYPRPKKSEEHPTMKPVALCARAISNSAAGGGIVLDPFGGSGSTLAACQELGRVCRTMELDPRYVDVIVARWEKLTGQKAKKLL